MVLEQNYQLLMTYFNNSDPKKHGGLKLRMRARITNGGCENLRHCARINTLLIQMISKWHILNNKVDLTNFFFQKIPRYGYNYLNDDF